MCGESVVCMVVRFRSNSFSFSFVLVSASVAAVVAVFLSRLPLVAVGCCLRRWRKDGVRMA